MKTVYISGFCDIITSEHEKNKKTTKTSLSLFWYVCEKRKIAVFLCVFFPQHKSLHLKFSFHKASLARTSQEELRTGCRYNVSGI